MPIPVQSVSRADPQIIVAVLCEGKDLGVRQARPAGSVLNLPPLQRFTPREVPTQISPERSWKIGKTVLLANLSCTPIVTKGASLSRLSPPPEVAIQILCSLSSITPQTSSFDKPWCVVYASNLPARSSRSTPPTVPIQRLPDEKSGYSRS